MFGTQFDEPAIDEPAIDTIRPRLNPNQPLGKARVLARFARSLGERRSKSVDRCKSAVAAIGLPTTARRRR